MDIAKFTIKTAADATIRLGAGASGPAFAFSLGISALKNILEFTPKKKLIQAVAKNMPMQMPVPMLDMTSLVNGA